MATTLLVVATTATFAGLWASALDNGSSGASSGGEDSSDFTVLAGGQGEFRVRVYMNITLTLPSRNLTRNCRYCIPYL